MRSKSLLLLIAGIPSVRATFWPLWGGGGGSDNGGQLCPTTETIAEDCWKKCEKSITNFHFCLGSSDCQCQTLQEIAAEAGDCSACHEASKNGNVQLNLDGSNMLSDTDSFHQIVENTFWPWAKGCGYSQGGSDCKPGNSAAAGGDSPQQPQTPDPVGPASTVLVTFTPPASNVPVTLTEDGGPTATEYVTQGVTLSQPGVCTGADCTEVVSGQVTIESTIKQPDATNPPDTTTVYIRPTKPRE